jgi:hypothetical protein
MKRVVMAAIGVACVCFLAAHAAQEVYINEDMTWTGSGTPRFTPVYGPDLMSPANYRDGHWYMRWEVKSKPSTKLVTTQLCMWQSGFSLETCSSCSDFTAPDVYWIDLGTPAGWWKISGGLNWSASFTAVGVMLKQNSCGDVLLTASACGTHCYPNATELQQHVPIETHTQVIMVSQGASLEVPPEWAGCPWGEPIGVSIRDMTPQRERPFSINVQQTRSAVRIAAAGDTGLRGRIDIVSADGRIARTFDARGEREFVWNTGTEGRTNAAPGIYFVKVTRQDGAVVGEKAVVTR